MTFDVLFINIRYPKKQIPGINLSGERYGLYNSVIDELRHKLTCKFLSRMKITAIFRTLLQ